MDKIHSSIHIQNAISTVKGKKKGFITNFYPEMNKINIWIKNGNLYQEIVEETVFFLRKKDDFSYLFYFTTTTDALKHSLLKLKTLLAVNQFVVDIIGKEPDVQSIVKVFMESGFYKYTILNRMNKSSFRDVVTSKNARIKMAKESDSEEIHNLLYQYFDSIAEQLPDMEDVNHWIKLNHIVVFEENNKILGFVIYDLTGMTSYLRYWFVHPNHRNKKIGSTLLNEYFKNSKGTKRQLFWVIQSNKNAIKRYIHYGFNSENLYDYIMTNKKIYYETKNN